MAASPVSISPLLLKLSDPATALSSITAAEIAAAVALVFSDSLSPVQTGCLLYALHVTQLDRRPDVLAACAESMREAANKTDDEALVKAFRAKNLAQGGYRGGLFGTGGDSHNTYNVSTTTSIICSPLLCLAKHGNNASTSTSGSADLLQHTTPAPSISSASPASLPTLYARTNYAFLYARDWHPAMRHAAPIRTQLPFRTIFNLLGPLANPVAPHIEARVLGVARRPMGPVFADALRLARVPAALVVCGAEDLDELSCAGPTLCWLVRGGAPVLHFEVGPEDLGLRAWPLAEVAGGRSPAENAVILARILAGEEPLDGPIGTFVLINAAALLAVSGVCDADGNGTIAEVGPGGLRWKEGVRRARWCVAEGRAKAEWDRYVAATREIAGLE